METKQNRFLLRFNIAGDVVCLPSEISHLPVQWRFSPTPGTFLIDNFRFRFLVVASLYLEEEIFEEISPNVPLCGVEG